MVVFIGSPLPLVLKDAHEEGPERRLSFYTPAITVAGSRPAKFCIVALGDERELPNAKLGGRDST